MLEKQEVPPAVSGRSIARNTAWTAASQYYEAVLRFAASIFLARTIAPEYFGQQGLSAAVFSVIALMVMYGQNLAIFRQKDQIEKFLGVQVTIRIVVVSVVACVLGVLVAANVLPLEREVQLLALAIFAAHIPGWITSIYFHNMERLLMFKKIAWINSISVTGAICTGCVLAYYGVTVWALMSIVIIDPMLKAALTMLLAPSRPRPGWDMAMVRQFRRFGSAVFMSTAADRLYGKVDQVMVGSAGGTLQLAYYQRALSLSALPQQALGNAFLAVGSPYFGRIKERPEQVGRLFEITGGLLMRFSIGAFVLLALVAPQAIGVLYGDEWAPAADLFRYLLPFCVFQMFSLYMVQTILVVSSPRRVIYAQVGALLLLLVLLVPLTLNWGAQGAAIAVDISSFAGTVALLLALRAIAPFSVARILVAPAAAAVLGAGAVLLWRGLHIDNEATMLVRLAAATITYGAVYLGALILLEFSYLRDAIGRLKQGVQD